MLSEKHPEVIRVSKAKRKKPKRITRVEWMKASSNPKAARKLLNEIIFPGGARIVAGVDEHGNEIPMDSLSDKEILNIILKIRPIKRLWSRAHG